MHKKTEQQHHAFVSEYPPTKIRNLALILRTGHSFLLIKQRCRKTDRNNTDKEKLGDVMATRRANILILCKTYPSPSAKYTETSCVAGLEENGELIRLYPVPFRYLTGDQKFQKWQWINARVEKTREDRRPESHRIYVDELTPGDLLTTRQGWFERRKAIQPLKVFNSFDELDAAREDRNISLGLLRPNRLVDLEIVPTRNKDWTQDELDKLLQEQGDLFQETKNSIRQLEKIPYGFYYHYECDTQEGPKVYKNKIVDWEICALYRKLLADHGPEGWEAPFRDKLMRQFSETDLVFLMGNMHRYQHQWLIVSLIYPPKERQQALF